MKVTLAAFLLLAACTDEQNAGFTMPSALGQTRWTVALGGGSPESARAVATDSLGDVVAVGDTYSNPADYGSGPVSVPRTRDFHSFITKRVASDGAERWTIPLYPSAANSLIDVLDLVVAPDDTIVAGGVYWGTVDVGGQTLTFPVPDPPDRTDCFVVKYAPNGALTWAKQLGVNGEIWAMVTDGAGRIYVSGTARGTVDVDGTPVDAGDFGMFLMALDAAGTKLWTHVFPCQGAAQSLAIAGNGDVLAEGSFAGLCSFGGAVHDGQANSGIFVTRFRNDGLYMASRTFGPQNSQNGAHQLAVDASGRILVSYTQWPYGTGNATSVVEAIDANLNTLWSVSLKNHQSGSPPWRNLVAMTNGQFVSTAWNNTPHNADHPDLDTGEMEVATLDAVGGHGISHFGTLHAGQAGFRDSAVASTGAVAFVGTFSGTADFGTGAVPTHGIDNPPTPTQGDGSGPLPTFGDEDLILVYVAPAY